MNKLSEHSGTKINGIMTSVIGGILCIIGLASPQIISFEEIRKIKKKPSQNKRENESLELLKKRYAKGKINEEEYEKIKEKLEG